jgi:hypothetical protein
MRHAIAPCQHFFAFHPPSSPAFRRYPRHAFPNIMHDVIKQPQDVYFHFCPQRKPAYLFAIIYIRKTRLYYLHPPALALLRQPLYGLAKLSDCCVSNFHTAGTSVKYNCELVGK